MEGIHIPTLAPDLLFQWGPLMITNTMINVWIALFFFLAIGLLLRKRVVLIPGKFQNFCEYVLELLFPYFDQVTNNRKDTIRFLPIVGSIFFFILLSNWMGLLPGTGSIIVNHHFLLRPAGTDINLTLAMALVSVLFSHVIGFISIGFFTHVNKFIQIGSLIKSFKKGPVAVGVAIVEFFVGLLEIISEVAKVLSLSLRLFGNIFAGEVLLSVIATIAAFAVPTPFMMLELLVGVVQAAVFAMLTLVYLTIAASEPHGAEH